ncbi:toll-like receptor Tollo [Branchiostoma lanceolatum]|uniref:toll-like receptor Tollo n=1 Tax=Branchiostoma lanceolatum TaxID=7740 RepID=UPI003456C40F
MRGILLFMFICYVGCHGNANVATTTVSNIRPTLSSNGDVQVFRSQLLVCALQYSISTYTCTGSDITTLNIADVDFFDATVTKLTVNCIYKINHSNFTVFDNLPSFIKTVRLWDCFEEEIGKEILHGLTHVECLDIGNDLSLFSDGYDPHTTFSRIKEPLDPVRLDPDLFASVPKLKKLSIHWLYMDAFPEAIYHQTNDQAHLKNLEELDLSFNEIPEIKPECLNNMPKLRSFDMSFNRIKNLSDPFLMMQNLQNLYMSGNFIDSLDGSPFKALPELGTLVLSLMRPIRNVTLPGPAGQKYPVRGSLQFIYPSSFYGLSNLRILDLHPHSILLIQNETFRALGSLEQLDLSVGLVSAIEENGFEGLQSLTSLDLSYNNLSRLGTSLFHNLPALLSLNLEGNYLHSLPGNVFLGVHLLTSLKLGYNNFIDIPSDILRPLVRLKLLSINHNYLKSVEGLLLGLSSTYCEDIDISFNNISTLDASILPTLAVAERTITLNLSHNAITTVYATNSYFDISASQSLKQLRLTLDLRWNRLLSIPFQLDRFSFFSLPRIVIDGNDHYRYAKIGLHHQLTLQIRHNPIICDCMIYELLQNIATAQRGVLYAKTDFKELTCHVPEDLRGIKLDDLSPSQTWCQKWDSSDCPSACDCMVQGEPNSTISPWNELVDCSGKNLFVIPDVIPNVVTILHLRRNNIRRIQQTAFMKAPLTRELYLSDNNITKIDSAAFIHIQSLEILYLDGNDIEEITGYEFVHLENLRELYLNSSEVRAVNRDAFGHLPSLEVLSLEDNLLNTLPENLFSALSNLQHLFLSGNNFRCDCDILWFKYWIRNKESILKEGNITCTHEQNQVQENIETLSSISLGCDLQNTERKSKITIGFSIVVVLLSLIIVVGFVLYKKKGDLQVYLYSRYGWRFREDNEDMDKPYDAFLSYSQHDLDFILQHILPGLETREPPFRVCLHHRDFIPGVPIAENILNAVEESRRTIVVVSRNFLDSDWCQLEFQAAHAQVLRERANRLIMILLEDIPVDDAPPDIKHYLQTNTYLRWGDERFWERLVYVMPRPRHYEELVQNMEQEPLEIPEICQQTTTV